MSRPPARSCVLAVVAVLAASLGLTACAAQDPADQTDAAESAVATGDGFPVTIEHAFGQTEINEEPERIVTIGWYSQDIVAALGTVPVGVPDFSWGTVDTYLPWFADRVEELGGELPAIIDTLDDSEINFEQIGALEPDLIVAAHSGITEEDYVKLSAVAPTIAYAETAWVSDRDELTLTIGEALGQRDDAQRLLDDADAAIAEAAASHPEFADVVFTYGWYLPEGATTFDFYLEGDPRVALVEELGFTASPQIVEASAGGDSVLSVSLEEMSTIESDFHIGWVDTAADVDRMLGDAVLAQWKPFATGSYSFIEDQRLGWATGAPSVLSIPDTIGDLADQLAAGLQVD